MEFNLIINQILTLFSIIFIGYIVRKKGLINDEISKGLSNLLIDIIMPALIITSMMIELNPEIIKNIKVIGLISVVSYVSVILLAHIISRRLHLTKPRKTIFIYLLVFGNVGYMGYPVLNAIYPEFGVFYAVISNTTFNILVFTYGIYLFIKDKESEEGIQFKKLINNGLISVIIGFFLLLTQYKLPALLTGALESLGDMVSPLSMLIIGSSLTGVKFKTIFKDKHLYLLGFLKLLIIPFIGLSIIKQFDFPTIINNISIILLAMPSAANGVIFAEKYDGDYTFASEGVFFTTLISIITIPVLLWLIA